MIYERSAGIVLPIFIWVGLWSSWVFHQYLQALWTCPQELHWAFSKLIKDCMPVQLSLTPSRLCRQPCCSNPPRVLSSTPAYWPRPRVPEPGGCPGGWVFHSQGCSVHSSRRPPWGLPLSAAAGCLPEKQSAHMWKRSSSTVSAV